MATAETSSTSSAIAIDSYDTALCIVPPKTLWPAADRLRALYDKAYEKWPPHINVVYPFVRPEALPRAAELIQALLPPPSQHKPMLQPRLHSATGCFAKKHGVTIHLCDSHPTRAAQLDNLRRQILEALGQSNQAQNNHHMHMTIAQSDDAASSSQRHLVNKVSLLPPMSWDVDRLYILVRERLPQPLHVSGATSQMKIWGIIDPAHPSLLRLEQPLAFYEAGHSLSSAYEDDDDAQVTGDGDSGEKDQLQSSLTCYFDEETCVWLPLKSTATLDAEGTPATLAVSSYNILAEFDWPPSQARYPLIIKNILSESGLADVLVLQEVTDDFLSYLLKNNRIRDTYPYSSHGPPEEVDMEPLPSMLNTVILSKWAFDWEWVSFKRKHKGAVVAKFRHLGRKDENGDVLPAVVAAVHLTRGLTDGAVAVKKIDLQKIIRYLSATYPMHPWILAGDFNISTSTYTIQAAMEKKAISAQSAEHLSALDKMFAEAKLVDAWAATRSESGDDDEKKAVEEGEQGATYDPTVNEVAAANVGSGYNMRPQRYDRILVRGEGLLEIANFNHFGLLKGKIGDDDPDAEETYASDHWGVRCVLKVNPAQDSRPEVVVASQKGPESTSKDLELNDLVVPVRLKRAPAALSGPGAVEDCLSKLNVFPSDEEIAKRETAFGMLKSVLLDAPSGEATEPEPATTRPQPSPVVIVPVGSYALGVWTSTSDMDVLCIGPFSANTFFALATQRLRKAPQGHNVKILRRVRASSGTMLELEVQGIRVDLQYCPATSVAEQWPDALKLPASDPIWTLSPQTLNKLKAVRDLHALQTGVSDLETFRVAHRFIKTWARSRGIYSAKFGYLSGIQIAILLARACKLLARSGEVDEVLSVEDVVVTFFDHYANFDWKTQLAFDPLFHADPTKLPYNRTQREPLAILGYFPPVLNTAQAASVPSVRVIADEFRRAASALLSPGATSWSAFLGSGDAEGVGAVDFLQAYKSYVKIDVQYWGLSPSRGAQFVGWLESRCPSLLVDLNRRVPKMHARIWPARFVFVSPSSVSDDDDVGEGGEGRDYQGCYLIGLTPANNNRNNNGTTFDNDERKIVIGAIHDVLSRFETNIKKDEKYYNAQTCWVACSMVDQRSLSSGAGAGGGLVVDAREWGDYTPGVDEEPDSDDEDPLEDEQDQPQEGWVRKGKKGKGKKVEEELAVRLGEGRKFRTAGDVMNRLRWDHSGAYASSDYVVGYEDRFLGAQEKALDAWKTEQTDEEFIPQHRILYFKKISTGVKVWERKTRVDLVFGSGV